MSESSLDEGVAERGLGRREFLRLGGLTALGLGPVGSALAIAGCRNGESRQFPPRATARSRPRSGPSRPAREVRIVAEVSDVDLGPLGAYRTWLYNGEFPAPEIRVREGERLRVTLENRLPEPTTIHWHGLPVPNAMDGVPGVTQAPVPPGDTFVYEFTASPAGSYLFHTHAGLQLDRGLLGPLVVEETTPHVAYDREYTLVLDDLLRAEPRLVSGGGMGMMAAAERGLPYDTFLIDGRPPADPAVLEVVRGERVRLRLLNLAAVTPFRVCAAGHAMSVTHADGRPIRPVEVDSLSIASGERYDVLVEANNPGVWNLVAVSAGETAGSARALLRYRGVRRSAPPEGQMPDGLDNGRALTLRDLEALELPDATAEFNVRPDRVFDLALSGGMMREPGWSIEGQAYPDADPIEIRRGEKIRIRIFNLSMMNHPMHLHGHFFRAAYAVKDTIEVPAHMGHAVLDFDAENPGDWLFHCHNLYHMESGMARVLRYV